MNSRSTPSSSGNRRKTFSGAGEGIENAINKQPSRASLGGNNGNDHHHQQSMNNNNNSSATKVGVRFTVPTNNNNSGDGAATNNNKMNTSIISTSMTPSKRAQDKFRAVASGKKDAIGERYFANTPGLLSHKKKRKHHSHNNHNGGGEGNEHDTSVAADNSFQLGHDTTAEILKLAVSTNNTNNSILMGDPMNESLLSTASSSTNTNNTSASSTSSSSDMEDALNVTTLSDTHELSTSNFIQNARMRGVLAERAKAFYHGNNKDKGKEGKANKEKEKEKGGGRTSTTNSTNDNVAMGERQVVNNTSKDNNMALGGGEATATLTLPDLTMNITGLLSEAAADRQKTSVAATKKQNETKEPDGGEPIEEEEEEEEEGEILEFTSHQKSRTPRKSSTGELSLLSSLLGNSNSDDTTRSVGGLDSMLADFDDDVGDEMEDAEKATTTATTTSNKSKKDVIMTTDLTSLIEESAKMIASDDNSNAEEGKRDNNRETSYVESTASQNDLANLLADTSTTEEEEVAEESGKEKNNQAASESTPLATHQPTSTPEVNNQSISSLCPSPSFLSGKKQQGSGISSLRKSLGGDVSQIRKLTASLRKEKKGKKKRMSLPALAMSRQQQQSGVGRMSLGIVDNNSTKEQHSNVDSPPPPAKTADTTKSPPPETMHSPARNARGAAKRSPRRSPRRSPKKKSPVPAANSPARNTRSASKKKSPMRSSPPPTADSPARNTRSAKRGASPKHHSSSASSPARSLFNSPPSDLDDDNLAFSGGRKRGSTDYANNVQDESEPPKKRMSTSPDGSAEPTSSSLSKEYPFLSLSPNENGAAASTKVPNESTQTLMFGELMQGIENEMATAPEGKGSSFDNDEDSGEINFNTKHSRRNKRRETADTAELMDILSDELQDDESPKATTSAMHNENKSPHTPSAVAAPGMTSKTPKSILSSGKRGIARPKRNVGFGSPEAATYNVGSPSVSMTPMNPESVKEQFVMPEEEEQTAELENDLERLIAKGNDTSILLDPIEELDSSKDVSGASSDVGGMSFAGGERTEELETNILKLVDNRADESGFSLPSVSSVASAESSRHNDTSHEDMSMVEPTQTINLEGTIASLVGGHANSSAMQGEATQTMLLEGTLASLLDNRTGVQGNENDITLPSLSSTSTSPMHNDGNHQMVDGDDNSQTMNIEGTMASLLDAAPDNAAAGELTTQSQTLPLDANLEVLLRGRANNNNLPREDDTISALGMHTASHELRHERDFSRGLATQKEIVTAPLEPVDLKLEEVVSIGNINWESKVEANSDIFLEALSVTSENVCPSVKPESEKVLTTICEEIVTQLESIDNDSLFMEILQDKEDLMRSLQQHVRACEESDVKDQAMRLLEAQIQTQFSEWNDWLTSVADVYNNELSDSIVQLLRKDKTNISDRTSLIDQNREQVALPLLIKLAKRATKRNFERTKGEVLTYEDEVSELEAQLEEAERQLESLQSTNEIIHKVTKTNEKSEDLRKGEKGERQTADSSYFKFFSIERLHNWVLTGSSDSSISLVFRGLAAETSIQLSFAIGNTSNVTLNTKFGSLPSNTNSFLSVTGAKQTRFHPAVSGFLKSKMELLCQDMKRCRVSSPSEISSMIHFAELRVARIEQAAKELDAALGRCKNSFLQQSESLQDGYDFTAYLSAGSIKSDRLNVVLSIPDCYPFGVPIDVRLHSTSSSFDVESMTRQLRNSIKPGFGALTRAVDDVQSMMK